MTGSSNAPSQKNHGATPGVTRRIGWFMLMVSLEDQPIRIGSTNHGLNTPQTEMSYHQNAHLKKSTTPPLFVIKYKGPFYLMSPRLTQKS